MNELLTIAPPPKIPIGVGSPELWQRLEESRTLTYPTDFKKLITTYGSGQFAGFFGIANPFHKSPRDIGYEKFVELRSEGVLFSQREMPKYAAQFPVYPARGGLMPVGYDDNGGTIFWLMRGEPDYWPIVYMDNGYTKEFDLFELPLTIFMEKWLSGSIAPRLTPPGFFPLARPVFVPANE